MTRGIYLAVGLLAVSGCGRLAPAESIQVAGPSIQASPVPPTCAVEDVCTYPALPPSGYVCFKLTLKNSTKPGCTTYSYDRYTDPNCDPAHPSGVCVGSNGFPVNCCPLLNGPGPSPVWY